tara:strand:- start:58 stop:426 length:369 start_codon:yes stop_codon:yes gene_type:complete
MQQDIKVYWEYNSRIKHLANTGEISQSQVIKRTQTDKFPENSATVRLKDVASEKPWVTVHFRGEIKHQKVSWSSQGCQFCKVARVQYGRDYEGYCLSGELDGHFDFAQISKVMNQVKKALEL